MKPKSTVGAYEQVNAFLDERSELYGCILLCFGEIDCRTHIIKNAIAQGVTIAEAVARTVTRYLEFIDFLATKYRLPLFVWGPSISSDGRHHLDANLPAIGSNVERSFATFEFNRILSAAARSFRHFTTIEDQVDALREPRTEMFWDGVHLNAKALPAAAALFRKELDAAGLSHLLKCLEPAWPLLDQAQLRNVVAGMSYTVSSSYGGFEHSPFDHQDDGVVRFHTEVEDEPSITFDLGCSMPLKKVVAFNGQAVRAAKIAVLLSNDNNYYVEADTTVGREVWTKDGVVGFDLSGTAPMRFLRLQLRERNYFYLSCVQAYAMSFLKD